MCSSVVIVFVSRVTADLSVMSLVVYAPAVLHVSAPIFVTDVWIERSPLRNS